MSYALYDGKTGFYSRIIYERGAISLELPGLAAGCEFSSELTPAHKHVCEKILKLVPQRDRDQEKRERREKSLLWPLGMRKAEQVLSRGGSRSGLRAASPERLKGLGTSSVPTLPSAMAPAVSSGPYGPAGPTALGSSRKPSNSSLKQLGSGTGSRRNSGSKTVTFTLDEAGSSTPHQASWGGKEAQSASGGPNPAVTLPTVNAGAAIIGGTSGGGSPMHGLTKAESMPALPGQAPRVSVLPRRLPRKSPQVENLLYGREAYDFGKKLRNCVQSGSLGEQVGIVCKVGVFGSR